MKLNPKQQKMLVKLAVGAIFSLALGKTYVLSKIVDEKIDAHYADKDETTQDD